MTGVIYKLLPVIPLSRSSLRFALPFGSKSPTISYYTAASVLLVVSWWIIWVQKILYDLPHMARRLHDGDYEYFEHIDI